MPRTKWIIRAAYAIALFGLICCLRAPLLTGLAETWIVRQNIEPADAIMVLGGRFYTRPFAAARLYHEGYAPKILISDVNPEQETKLTKEILLENAVPENAIIVVGHKVSSTYEEAVALRDWVRATGATKVIVPTEIFHTRRVSWIFAKMLKGTGAVVRVQALQPETKFTAVDWWQHKDGILQFQTEIIKFLFYWIRY
jgi:uncharacterized SAM-binding protein YcdF (DUF218 family)